MLEAKAKDQRHKRKCSPKKKGLHKNFSGDLQNKKKRSSQKFFKRSPQKNVFQRIFQAPQAEDRPIFENLRPRGHGQGLQNVSSRTPPLRGSKLIALDFESVMLRNSEETPDWKQFRLRRDFFPAFFCAY